MLILRLTFIEPLLILCLSLGLFWHLLYHRERIVVVIPQINQTSLIKERPLNFVLYFDVGAASFSMWMDRKGASWRKLSLHGLNEHAILIECFIENES